VESQPGIAPEIHIAPTSTPSVRADSVGVMMREIEQLTLETERAFENQDRYLSHKQETQSNGRKSRQSDANTALSEALRAADEMEDSAEQHDKKEQNVANILARKYKDDKKQRINGNGHRRSITQEYSPKQKMMQEMEHYPMPKNGPAMKRRGSEGTQAAATDYSTIMIKSKSKDHVSPHRKQGDRTDDELKLPGIGMARKTSGTPRTARTVATTPITSVTKPTTLPGSGGLRTRVKAVPALTSVTAPVAKSTAKSTLVPPNSANRNVSMRLLSVSSAEISGLRDEMERKQQAIEALEHELVELRAHADNLESFIGKERGTRERLEREAHQMELKVEEAEQAHQETLMELQNVRGDLEEMEARNADVDVRLEEYKDKIAVLQEDKVRLQDQLEQLRGEARAAKANDKMREQSSQREVDQWKEKAEALQNTVAKLTLDKLSLYDQLKGKNTNGESVMEGVKSTDSPDVPSHTSQVIESLRMDNEALRTELKAFQKEAYHIQTAQEQELK
jgi:hypothetical protein